MIPIGAPWGFARATRRPQPHVSLGNRTTTMFDAVGNTQALPRPLGFRTSYPDGSRVTFAWDETGNRTLLADATGRTTWLYDALNRTRVNRQPNSKTITYSCDPVGNRATMRDPDGGRFTYAHDPASRLSGLENPWNERTSFNYDAASRRTLKKLANGTRASFSYDAADRLTTLDGERDHWVGGFACFAAPSDCPPRWAVSRIFCPRL